MSKNKRKGRRRQGDLTPPTTVRKVKEVPEVAQFSVSEVAQFSMSLDSTCWSATSTLTRCRIRLWGAEYQFDSTSTQQSLCTIRTSSRSARNDGLPLRGCRARASSRWNRTSGVSPVVPWMRTSATSRVQRIRWASSSAQLPNSRPAIAFFLT